MGDGQAIVVGLGEVKVAAGAGDVLVCLGLGSCICLAVYDPVRKAGGMAHIVLPDSAAGAGVANAKFADVAVPELLRQMTQLGAAQERLVARIAGGAEMALARSGGGTSFNIGGRNSEATRRLMASAGLRCHGADTGGTHGRTVRLYVRDGRATVTFAGQAPRDL
jgi:chemotaxis protein CheD